MAAVVRIVAGSPATIEWQAADQHGEPSDPGATTAVASGPDGQPFSIGAVSGTGTTRQVSFTAPDHPTLITITWTGTTGAGTTTVEVVGGVYFTWADLCDAEATARDWTRYRSQFAAARDVVEATFEQYTGQVFVPRFRWLTSSNGAVRHPQLRSIMYVDGPDGISPPYVTLFGRQRATVPATATRVGCVVGMDAPPADVRQAAMRACRNLLTESSAQVNFQPAVTLQQDPEGQIGQSLPPFVTGDSRVDAVLKRYRRWQTGGTIRVAASSW